MTDKRRKQRIAELKDQGRQAYTEGRHTPPSDINGGPDAMHWYTGHDEAQAEALEEERAAHRRTTASDGFALRLQLANAIHEHASTGVEFSLQRLLQSLEEWEDHIVNRTKQEIRHEH